MVVTTFRRADAAHTRFRLKSGTQEMSLWYFFEASSLCGYYEQAPCSCSKHTSVMSCANTCLQEILLTSHLSLPASIIHSGE